MKSNIEITQTEAEAICMDLCIAEDLQAQEQSIKEAIMDTPQGC